MTKVALGASRHFEAVGLRRQGWANAGPIRDIFRKAVMTVGVPYFNPHKFRNALTQHGEQVCRTPEEFKAWSQNIGHKSVPTTFASYGTVNEPRQREIIKGMRSQGCAPEVDLQSISRHLALLVERGRH